jgi:hypothetical protein
VTGSAGAEAFEVGDRVCVIGETDHPEDPVGTVVMFLAHGGIVVLFPLAGAEIYTAAELRRA